jgi:hypothetical protein
MDRRYPRSRHLGDANAMVQLMAAIMAWRDRPAQTARHGGSCA